MMDEIYIPLAKKISSFTYGMVDRFSSYTEALSVPVATDKIRSFIAIARHVMKKTTKQHYDVENLFSTLQKVTLTLVEERLKQFPLTENTKHRLPQITRLQKQAIETKVRTFDDVCIERIKQRSLQIRQMVEKHKSRLQKLITQQELCWKAESKYEEISLTLSTSVRSRDFLQKNGSPSEADVRTRNKEIEKLTSKLSKKSQMTESCNFEYEEKVGYENADRNNLHKMSEDLCDMIRSKIAERLVYGIGCLRDVITGFSDVDKYEECLQLMDKINVPKIVASILAAASEKYICPRVTEYNQTYGFKTRLPDGKIIHGTDAIPDNKNAETKRKQTKPEKEIAKSQSEHGKDNNGTDTPQETQDTQGNIDEKDRQRDSESSLAEQETTEAPPSGIVTVTKSRICVTAATKVKERAPGLLKLKKGLRIKQKLGFCDMELCFGWCRPGILSTKVWGFYYKNQITQESDQ